MQLDVAVNRNTPHRRNFALHPVPDIGHAGLQRNPHSPPSTIVKLDKVTDVVAPVGGISKHAAGLGRIVPRSQPEDGILVDGGDEGMHAFLNLLIGWRELGHEQTLAKQGVEAASQRP